MILLLAGCRFVESTAEQQAGSSEVKADAFYDDLYVGPAAANPNRPEP